MIILYSTSCDRIAANPAINTRKNNAAIIFSIIGILFVKRVRIITVSHIAAIEISSVFDHSEKYDCNDMGRAFQTYLPSRRFPIQGTTQQKPLFAPNIQPDNGKN